MKYVTVPAPVTPKNYDGKDFTTIDEEASIRAGKQVIAAVGEVSIHRYLMTYVINEKHTVKNAHGKDEEVLKIGRGYEGNKRSRKLDNLFKNAVAGEVVGVEDEDHKLVAKIIVERDWPNSSFGMCFSSIEEAWMTASEEKPAVKVPAKVENGRELPPSIVGNAS